MSYSTEPRGDLGSGVRDFRCLSIGNPANLRLSVVSPPAQSTDIQLLMQIYRAYAVLCSGDRTAMRCSPADG